MVEVVSHKLAMAALRDAGAWDEVSRNAARLLAAIERGET